MLEATNLNWCPSVGKMTGRDKLIKMYQRGCTNKLFKLRLMPSGDRFDGRGSLKQCMAPCLRSDIICKLQDSTCGPKPRLRPIFYSPGNLIVFDLEVKRDSCRANDVNNKLGKQRGFALYLHISIQVFSTINMPYMKIR